MAQDNSIPLQAFQGESPVDNYLQALSGAKQQKRADQQAAYQDQQHQWLQDEHAAAQKQQQVQAVAKAAFALDTPEKWAAQAPAIMQQLGIQGPVPGFDQRDTILANAQTVDGLIKQRLDERKFGMDARLTEAQIGAQKANAAQSYAAAEKDRAAASGVRSGSIDPTTGQPSIKLTEGQAKDLSYYRRGVASNNKLDDARSKEMMSGWNSTFADAPVIGNAWLSPSARQGQQAAKDFIAAILRRDTGAAVSDSEFNYYASFLLPQYGDDATTLAQKKESRAQALDSIKAGLGTAQILSKFGPQPVDPNAPPAPAGATGKPGESTVFRYDANGNRVQ